MIASPQTAPEGFVKRFERDIKKGGDPYSRSHPQLATRIWYADKFIELRDANRLPNWIYTKNQKV